MSARQHPFVMAAILLSVFGIIGIFVMKTSLTTNFPRVTASDQSLLQTAARYKHQRDDLSKMLNEVKREVAVLSCELIEIKRKHNKSIPLVSASGGWCRKSSLSNSGSHFFDKPLAVALSLLFENKTVASFGDGPGDYKKYLDSTHLLNVYDAYDGAPYGPETSGGVVKFLDLTAPQYGLPVYDWIISLEVAEHIPAKYEDIYVDNIVRHAGSGIVLSWAIPGQGGLSHINNRPLPYVQKILSSKGFESDMNASMILQTKASLPWLKGNVYVYRRRTNSVILADYA